MVLLDVESNIKYIKKETALNHQPSKADKNKIHYISFITPYYNNIITKNYKCQTILLLVLFSHI